VLVVQWVMRVQAKKAEPAPAAATGEGSATA
jgi:hypothetical protein